MIRTTIATVTTIGRMMFQWASVSSLRVVLILFMATSSTSNSIMSVQQLTQAPPSTSFLLPIYVALIDKLIYYDPFYMHSYSSIFTKNCLPMAIY